MYELKGALKAVDMLSSYHGIRRMKIVVDGRKVGNSARASESCRALLQHPRRVEYGYARAQTRQVSTKDSTT